jgi:hypothetical protein
MMLELEDAVKVARQYMIDRGYHFDDEEDGVILTQEMEQKCYISERVGTLRGLVQDINPTEICAQIESDNLSQWCKVIQTEFFLRLKMGMEQHGIQTKD